ncbi:hypothetical protein DFQ28_010886, partial [Apophysomyces sp. BC1034]
WNGLRNVRTLAKMFRKCGMQHVVCVPRAKVPIVRLFDPESQLACDINVNNTMALQNTKLIKTYVAIDPRVRPLAMAIKHWTKQRILNDAANGGTLSTYTWTCMIINFLQMREPPILPVLHHLDSEDEQNMFCSNVEKFIGFGEANHESVGGLFFAFFRRFAVEFNYDDHVISVRRGCYLSKREKEWHFGRDRTSFCVEEPFNITRNLGNSADAASVNGLRIEFRRALEFIVAGIPLDGICSPYRIPSFSSKLSNEKQKVPPTISPVPTVLLPPSRNPRTQAATLLLSTSPCLTHPHDRRRSMVDDMHRYSHESSDPCESRLSHRLRQSSHPSPSVPFTLLTMLQNEKDTDGRTVDSIFARYRQPTIEYRRSSINQQDTSVGRTRSSRRKSTNEWPSITNQQFSTSRAHETNQRRRRWSTVKKEAEAAASNQQRTMAEIVKLGGNNESTDSGRRTPMHGRQQQYKPKKRTGTTKSRT